MILERVGGPQEAHRRPDRGRILGPGAGSGHQELAAGRRAKAERLEARVAEISAAQSQGVRVICCCTSGIAGNRLRIAAVLQLYRGCIAAVSRL